MSESVEAGLRVKLPAGAEAPIEVYVNGSRKSEGDDYVVRGNEILFSQPLMKEKVSGGRWLAMTLGLFGSYGEHDTVDIHFQLNGELRTVSEPEILP